MLAAVRDLNRVELVAETLRAALNAIAAVAPAWLRALVPPEWHERYGRRIEDARLPGTDPKRDAYVARVGADGFLLLGALGATDAPPLATALPAVAVLRRVWARHFERGEVDPDRDARGACGCERCRVAAPATASGLPTMPTPASLRSNTLARSYSANIPCSYTDISDDQRPLGKNRYRGR